VPRRTPLSTDGSGCTVTAAADQDARAAIRRIHGKNPEARIVVTGCYAQRAPEEIAALPGVSQVIGNSHKHQLAELAVGLQTSDVGPQQAQFVPLTQLTPDGRRPMSAGPDTRLRPRFGRRAAGRC